MLINIENSILIEKIIDKYFAIRKIFQIIVLKIKYQRVANCEFERLKSIIKLMLKLMLFILLFVKCQILLHIIQSTFQTFNIIFYFYFQKKNLIFFQQNT